MDQVKIGRYISEKRKTLGLTQTELAEKLGMSHKSVSKWERGVCLPDVSVYMELCGILGISLNEFLQGEDLEPETVEKRSEENIISVTKAGNKRSKKFQKTAAALGILVILLAAFSLTFLIREGYLGGNYLKSYDIESNASQLSRAVMPLGNVQLYEFSCDKSYKEIEISVYKKDGGRMRNKLIGSAEFPFPYDPESGKRASGKGTLVIAYYDGKLTVSGMGVCGYQAYQLELSDVIEGFDGYMFDITKTIGQIPFAKDGVRKSNLFGISLIGPVLVKNPFFATYLTKLIAQKRGVTYRENPYPYEEKGYAMTLKALTE
jgi:transcriptional regulator with XRE-family HTH domain